MANNIITNVFKKYVAASVVNDFTDTPHFMFVGKHTPYEPDDSSVEVPVATPQQLLANTYNEMMFGKKVTTSDVSVVIPRHDWESGTVYAQYDHADPLLFSKNFFVTVDNAGYFHVYKCLFNNNGAASTVQPTGQDLEPFVTPSDGYVWKYMYSFSTAQNTKFATDDFVPVVANTAVEAAAVPGSIEAIVVSNTGIGYENHYSSSFRGQDIEVGGNDTIYGLTEDASDLDYFYRDCIIKLTSGLGANQYRLITDYQVGGGQKLVTIETAFDTAPAATDTYKIYPAVQITGDGQETTNCVAWAIIDPDASDSVESIEVLNAGEGYRNATASVLADNTVGVTSAATLSPIISPALGHGHDPAEELGGSKVCVSVKFSNTESSTIPIDNDYRTIGILRDPYFANVHVAIDSFTQVGVFSSNEGIINYRGTPLTGTVAVTASSATVTGTSTFFVDSLQVGDKVLITDGVNNMYAGVSTKANNISFSLTSNCIFSNTGCTISKVDTVATATLSSSNASTLVLDDVQGSFTTTNAKILGTTSFTSVEMDAGASPIISINGDSTGNFGTFVQLQKLTGTLSGVTEFTEDEEVTQASTNASAIAFSFLNSTPDVLYVSGLVGSFSMGSDIIGETSGAAFNPSNKYPGALKVDSGKLVYLESIAPVTRASNKSETLKIILEF